MLITACRHCAEVLGLGDAGAHPVREPDEEFYEHLEAEHHLPVPRDGESGEAAIARFLATYSDVAECAECRDAGAPWATPVD